MAYFATQNTGVVHVALSRYSIYEIPLYIVVLGSLVFGFFVSFLISIFDSISSSLKIHGKDVKINQVSSTNKELQKRIRELELENAGLKAKNQGPSLQ